MKPINAGHDPAISLLSDGIDPSLLDAVDAEDTVTSAQFWELTGQMQGLCNRRDNAVAIRQLLLAEVMSKRLPRFAVLSLLRKVYLIRFLTAAERLSTRLLQAVPVRADYHLCAQPATLLYLKLWVRTENVLHEYGHPYGTLSKLETDHETTHPSPRVCGFPKEMGRVHRPRPDRLATTGDGR